MGERDHENGDDGEVLPITIAVIGPKSVGKTSITQRFVDRISFDQYQSSHTHAHTILITFKGLSIKLTILDTPEKTPRIAFRVDGFLLVYDASSRLSFKQLDSYDQSHCRSDAAKVLVANKSDLCVHAQQLIIPDDEAQYWAEERGYKFVKCNVANLEAIRNAFHTAIKNTSLFNLNYVPYQLKVLLIGECNVGKTSLTRRLTEDEFHEENQTTIGFNYQPKLLMLDGVEFKLDIWDTAGAERFRALTANYYRNADCALLVYDVTRRESFLKLDYWLNTLTLNCNKENCVTILVGNKYDLVAERKAVLAVKPIEARRWALARQVLYYENFFTSAKTATNVHAAFEKAIKVTSVYACALRDRNRNKQIERKYHQTLVARNGYRLSNNSAYLAYNVHEKPCCSIQ